MPSGTTAKPLISSFVPSGIVVSTALETPMFSANLGSEYTKRRFLSHTAFLAFCSGLDWSTALMVGNSGRFAGEGGRGDPAEHEGHSDEQFGHGPVHFTI